MAFIPHKLGIGGHNSDQSELSAHSLDLFSLPEVESSMIGGQTIKVHTTTSITENGPYEFYIPPSDRYYTYLPLTRLECEFEIRKKDGGQLDETSEVSLCNLYSSAIFSQIECYLNNTQVIDISSATYPYKSIIEVDLSYSKEAKETHLLTGLYLDDAEPAAIKIEESDSLKKRNKWIKKSKKVYFMTPLYLDIFQCERLLPPNVGLKLRLIKAEDSFGLIGPTNDFKISIKDLKLYVRKIEINEKLRIKHQHQISSKDMIFPYPCSTVRSYVIPSNITSTQIANICRGSIPKTVIACFVSSNSYSGKIDSNPFNFQHFDLNYLLLRVNGNPIPSQAFQPDFESGKYLREYRNMVDSCGILHDDVSNNITPKQFAKGKAYFVFDLSPDSCNGVHLHPSENGNVDIDIGFAKGNSSPIQLIIYSTYNGGFIVDKNYEV